MTCFCFDVLEFESRLFYLFADAPVYRVTDKKSHLGYKDTSRIKSFVRIPFHVHDCGYSCRERDDPARHKGKNPYLIPILLGWER